MAKFLSIKDLIINIDEILQVEKRNTTNITSKHNKLQLTTAGYEIVITMKNGSSKCFYYDVVEENEVNDDFNFIKSMLQAVSE